MNRLRAAAATVLRRLAAHLDPPRPVIERAIAAHPSGREPHLRPVDAEYLLWVDADRTRVVRPRRQARP